MDNAAIAKVCENITNLLELKGESPFEIRAVLACPKHDNRHSSLLKKG